MGEETVFSVLDKYCHNNDCFACLGCRHQIQAGHPIAPLQEAGMESRIQVLKGPFNILQLAQDKRSQFPSPGL